MVWPSALRKIAFTTLRPRWEHLMKSRIDFERKGGVRANSVRALVAALCVLGLASLTLLHSNGDGRIAAGYVASTQPTTDGPVVNSRFLHAPTGDPSVPSAESVFSRKDAAPDDDPPAPTF